MRDIAIADTTALTAPIVAQIWRDLGYETAPVPAEFARRAYRARSEALVGFCRVAIAPPHYANITDIAYALDVARGRINRTVVAIVVAAREDR